MSIYPSPCDKCHNDQKYDGCCPLYRTCSDWLTWWRWWWKQFNAYAMKHGIEPTTPIEQEEETND